MGANAGIRMVTIKRPEEIDRMRHAGSILADVLDAFSRELRPGISTADLDALADGMIRGAGAIPSFLGYRDFPRSICVSINDEVVHGIPSPRRHLRAGDVVGLDIGCIWQGWHADCARTFSIGEPAPRVRDLIEATRRALDAGIA